MRLETAARRRDTAMLCSIYTYEGDPPPKCSERSMAEIYKTRDGTSIDVRSVRLTTRNRAVAITRFTQPDTRDRPKTMTFTFQLARVSGTWKVVFVT